MMEIGADRIMFSTDWPFENIDHAAMWFDAAPISEADRVKIGRTNASELFKLKGWIRYASSGYTRVDRALVPDDAAARPVRHDRVAVNDLERLLHDLVGPVDIFEIMRGRRHREQMRAEPRDRDAMTSGCCARGEAPRRAASR